MDGAWDSFAAVKNNVSVQSVDDGGIFQWFGIQVLSGIVQCDFDIGNVLIANIHYGVVFRKRQIAGNIISQFPGDLDLQLLIAAEA